MSNFKTVEEIEESGKWVSVAHHGHGFSLDELLYWHRSGCPFLPGRPKIGAQLLVVMASGWPAPKPRWFFDKPTLAKIKAASDKADLQHGQRRPHGDYEHYEKLKREAAARKSFEKNGETWWALGEAVVLSCKSARTLCTYREKGCIELAGRVPKTLPAPYLMFGFRPEHFAETDLLAIRAHKEALPILRPDDEITYEEACKIAGRCNSILHRLALSKKLTTKLVPVQTAKGIRMRPRLSRAEVEAYRDGLSAEPPIVNGEGTWLLTSTVMKRWGLSRQGIWDAIEAGKLTAVKERWQKRFRYRVLERSLVELYGPAKSPRPGAEPPAVATPTTSGPATGPPLAAAPEPEQTKIPKRGRRKGWRDPVAQQRDQDIIDAWKSGQYETKSDLADKFNVDRAYVSRLVKGA